MSDDIYYCSYGYHGFRDDVPPSCRGCHRLKTMKRMRFICPTQPKKEAGRHE